MLRPKGVSGLRRFLRRLSKSKPDEHRLAKRLIGLSIGLVVSFGFHCAFVDRLDMPAKYRSLLGASSAVFFCLGGVMSVQLRCTMLLVIPTFFGHVGRGVLLAIAFSLVVQGPIRNMATNVQELVKVFSCVADIAINVTLNRLELLYHPAHDVMRSLLVVSHDVRGKVAMFGEALRPLITVVEDEEGIDVLQERIRSVPGMPAIVDRMRTKLTAPNRSSSPTPSTKFSKKLVTFCLQVVSLPVMVCHKVDEEIRPYFDDAGLGYGTACPDAIGEFCDNVLDLGDAFDEHYSGLKDFAQELDRSFDVALTFAFESHLDALSFEGVFYFKESIEEELAYRKDLLDFVIVGLMRSLTLLLLCIFYSATSYQTNYLRDNAFDNRYVNWYFRKIDARRKDQGKMTLLPLNKMEKRELTDALALKTLPKERSKFRSTLVLMTPQMLAIVAVFLADYVVTFALTLIEANAKIEYHMKAEHRINMTIDGSSRMANKLRHLLGNVRSEQSQDERISNEPCLPRPTHSDPRLTIAVFALHVLAFSVARVEAYGLRLRRILCAFCYHKATYNFLDNIFKREKQRTLWLYNKYLKKRKGFLEHRMKRLRKLANKNAIEADDNLLLVLRLTFPSCFGWLKRFSAAKRTCLVCGQRESSKRPLRAACDERNGHAYCDQCFHAIGGRCIPCSDMQ